MAVFKTRPQQPRRRQPPPKETGIYGMEPKRKQLPAPMMPDKPMEYGMPETMKPMPKLQGRKRKKMM